MPSKLSARTVNGVGPFSIGMMISRSRHGETGQALDFGLGGRLWSNG